MINTFPLILALVLTGALAAPSQGQADPLAGPATAQPALDRYYAAFDDLHAVDDLLSEVAGMSRAQRRSHVVAKLRDTASLSQAGVAQFLRQRESAGQARLGRRIWLNNVLQFRATAEVAEIVSQMPGVLYVRRDRIISEEEAADLGEPAAVPSSVPPTSNLDLINAPDVWAMGYRGEGTLVAIVDSGTNYNHPDLAANAWNNSGEIAGNGLDDDGNGYVDDFIGWDFGSNDNDPIHTSSSSHGTAVAGIVCGDGSSGTETGVAPRARFMVLRIAGASESDWWAAYQYAVDNGADVVDSSYSLKWPSRPDYRGYRQATDMELAAGVIHANSIGNQGGSSAYPIPFNISTPGNCPAPWIHPDQTLTGGVSAVLGCGALLNPNWDTIASFSGRGPASWTQADADALHGGPYPHPFAPYSDYPHASGGSLGLLKPDVCAPTNVTSLGNGYLGGGSHYRTFGGTSAATPHLGGLMALLLSVNPDLPPEEIARIIMTTATDLGPAGNDNAYGAGRIDCLAAAEAALGMGPAEPRVLISEVSWGNPDFIELTNHTSSPVNLDGWRLEWKDSATDSGTISGITIRPGESIVFVEGGSGLPPIGGSVRVVNNAFTSVITSGGDFVVALRSPSGFVTDEVRVASTAGSYSEGSLGGNFRGVVQRGLTSSGTGGSGSAERIWGLDSDGGADWTDARTTSPGFESLNSGPRGTDPVAVPTVLINELDSSPDYVELVNRSGGDLEMRGWHLVTAAGTGAATTGRLVRIFPFPDSFILPDGGYVVIGDSLGAPPEMPASVPYVSLRSIGGGNLPWVESESACALYDRLGRVVDAVHSLNPDAKLTHNHPRPPSAPFDFSGAAPRQSGGDSAWGRVNFVDSDTGQDWRAVYTRTMGSPNGNFSSGPGEGDLIDVRLNSTGEPGGLSLLVNAGPSAAGATWLMLASYTRLQGDGPFFGLGADTLFWYQSLTGLQPWNAVLDADGAYRFDVPAPLVGAGVTTDIIGIAYNAALTVFERTQVIHYDS